MSINSLPIVQNTYDFVKWYIPILNRLLKTHKFTLCDRIINELYRFLEELITVQFSSEKLAQLQTLNVKLAILR
jgi:hypothetical protein